VALTPVGYVTAAQAQEKDVAQPQEKNRVIYGGFGRADSSGPSESDSTPWSIGVYARQQNHYIPGFDIGREGTSFDWTAHRGGSVKQGTSFNLLVGRNPVSNDRIKLDAAVLLGIREKEVTCPSGQSVPGFDCYADTAPESDYGFNGGILLTATIAQRAVPGVRATEESVQAVVGLNF